MDNLQDFRGNSYEAGEDIGPVVCSDPRCPEPAVRNACNAEGNEGRTHWHGEIHSLDLSKGGTPRPYCETHGKAILSENNAIRARHASR